MLQKKQEGFTLVELLIAVMILAGAISGILMLFTTSMISSRQAWDTTVATTHAEHVLEEMVARETMENIKATDWNQWADTQHLSVLPNEKVDVALTDSGGRTLDVAVEISWMRKAQPYSIKLKTKIAK